MYVLITDGDGEELGWSGPYPPRQARQKAEQINRRRGVQAYLRTSLRPEQPVDDRGARVFGVAVGVSIAIAVWGAFAAAGAI